MKKFLLTLAAVAIATSALTAQNTTPTQGTIEEPDRVQMRELSKNPTGTDIATGYETPQVVAQKHECKDHKDGQACTKPADQQCDDCKAKAAAKQCDKAAMKHECKKGEGQQCDKAAMKHECGKCEGSKCAQGECKDGKCPKCEAQQCKDCKNKKGTGATPAIKKPKHNKPKTAPKKK